MSRERSMSDRQLSALLRRSAGALRRLGAEYRAGAVDEDEASVRRAYLADARDVTKLAQIVATGDLKRTHRAVLRLDTIVRDRLPNIVIGVAHYHAVPRWRDGRCYCPDCVRWTDQPDLYQRKD